MTSSSASAPTCEIEREADAELGKLFDALGERSRRHERARGIPVERPRAGRRAGDVAHGDDGDFRAEKFQKLDERGIVEQGAAERPARLRERGFRVGAIRPPTVPTGTSRLRLSLNRTLTDAQLERFADALREALASRNEQ